MLSLTVKQLAEELGITKQAVHKRINQLPAKLKPKKVSGVYRINIDTATYIRNSVYQLDNQSDNQSTIKKKANMSNDSLTAIIEEFKIEKKKIYDQIDKKDEQIINLQKLLAQQQQLTLQSNNEKNMKQLQLEEVQERNNKLQSKDENTKKWWKFWSN